MNCEAVGVKTKKGPSPLVSLPLARLRWTLARRGRGEGEGGSVKMDYKPVSEGGLGEPNQVGRVTPCAPSCPAVCRRARSDAPYPYQSIHGYVVMPDSIILRPGARETRLPAAAKAPGKS